MYFFLDVFSGYIIAIVIVSFSFFRFFSQFLLIQKNNNFQTSGSMSFTFGHYYFLEKVIIVKKTETILLSLSYLLALFFFFKQTSNPELKFLNSFLKVLIQVSNLIISVIQVYFLELHQFCIFYDK